MSEAIERNPDDWMAWDAEVAIRQEDGITSLHEARDAVIVEWLTKGDTRPFYDWVLLGHRPSNSVLRAIAYMMMRSDSPSFVPDVMPDSDLAASLAFGLRIDRTGAARPFDMEMGVVKKIAGREASRMMDAGSKGREAADPDTRDWLAKNGINVSLGTVEAARKEYRREKGKK
jgi:hypothetical protein